MMHEIYMNRCLQLASLAAADVAPNPVVGAVLVYNNRIIGEGYHKKYGGPHAEVECINNVKDSDRHLVPGSVLYVSLEPCAHFGKTPPCADLIIEHKIAKVVIGCRDPFLQVNGKGIEKLKEQGVEVLLGILEEECKKINKSFFTYHSIHRPYITLKWAQTADSKMGNKDGSRLMITNAYTNRLMHRLRSNVMAILVGTNTALLDDPELNTRLWPGNHPVRLVVDMHLKLPAHLKMFNDGGATIIFNLHKHTLPFEKISFNELRKSGLQYYQVTEDVNLVHQIVHALYQLQIQWVLVEGGAFLLQSFIDEKVWDEAVIITNESLQSSNGLTAPILDNYSILETKNLQSDFIRIFAPKN